MLPYPHILFYDGQCHACSFFVKTVMKIDRRGVIHYASLQSDFAENFFRTQNIGPVSMDTVTFVSGSRAFVRSEALFKVTELLGGVWQVIRILEIVPRRLLDRAYDAFARRRYIFGRKQESCAIIPPGQIHLHEDIMFIRHQTTEV